MDAVFSLQRSGADAVFSFQRPGGVEQRRSGGRWRQLPPADPGTLQASLWAILKDAVPFEAVDPERMEAAAMLLADGATLEAVVDAVLYAEPGGLVRVSPKRELLRRSGPAGWRRQ